MGHDVKIQPKCTNVSVSRIFFLEKLFISFLGFVLAWDLPEKEPTTKKRCIRGLELLERIR